MSGKINVTSAQMKIIANEYKKKGEEFEDFLSSMRDMLNKLQNEWEGSHSKAFLDAFEFLEPSFENIKELIENIYNTLSLTAQTLEEIDNNLYT